MTVVLERETRTAPAAGWHRVCMLEDLEPNWGEAAIIDGLQLALFRLPSGEVYAVAQQDPATLSNVMARGILGSRGNSPTIASPLHKEVYDLRTGECFTKPELWLQAFATRLVDGAVEVEL